MTYVDFNLKEHLRDAAGGSALPVEHDRYTERGITVRDYFAAKAMAATMSSDAAMGAVHGAVMKHNGKFDANDIVSGIAYQMADAMLKARSDE